jgi:gamma-glutamylcyclotransferase (GGCT)/AIG2-like uncharacterized protein YtfP
MPDQVTAQRVAENPAAIFVYGTLKRGQLRERCWPHRPLAVEPATVRGALYDLGPYPALVPGEDLVAGELWRIAEEHIAATLAALDRVEGFANRPDDLYRRVNIECRTAAGIEPAWTYQLAQTNLLSSARRIEPDEHGICQWKDHPTPR